MSGLQKRKCVYRFHFPRHFVFKRMSYALRKQREEERQREKEREGGAVHACRCFSSLASLLLLVSKMQFVCGQRSLWIYTLLFTSLQLWGKRNTILKVFLNIHNILIVVSFVLSNNKNKTVCIYNIFPVHSQIFGGLK